VLFAPRAFLPSDCLRFRLIIPLRVRRAPHYFAVASGAIRCLGLWWAPQVLDSQRYWTWLTVPLYNAKRYLTEKWSFLRAGGQRSIIIIIRSGSQLPLIFFERWVFKEWISSVVFFHIEPWSLVVRSYIAKNITSCCVWKKKGAKREKTSTSCTEIVEFRSGF